MTAKVVWTMVAAAAICGGSQVSAQTTARCDTQLPQHLRVLDCRLATALERGLERSMSLRSLVRRLGELHGIVYVSTPASLSGKSRLVGGLSHAIAAAGETRILHVTLVRELDYRDRAIATLAHEFTHALEVLESPDTRTEADVDTLYDRIGYVLARGVVETNAARAMGRVVAAELRASPSSKRR